MQVQHSVKYGLHQPTAFLQHVRIAPNADRCSSHGRSVSVCLSVRPLHSSVLSRRMKIRSCGLQYH